MRCHCDSTHARAADIAIATRYCHTLLTDHLMSNIRQSSNEHGGVRRHEEGAGEVGRHHEPDGQARRTTATAARREGKARTRATAGTMADQTRRAREVGA